MPRKTLADLNDPIAAALYSFEKAQAKVEAAWDEFDKKFWSTKTADNLRKGVTQEEFNDGMKVIQRLQVAAFGALDKWRHMMAHKDDPSTEPSVPVSEVSAVISASLSDKIDDLDFSINHGLLASKIANTIKMDVEEGDVGEIPFCVDHS